MQKTAKKPKIEAIYPLGYMQQGLLFHHLSSSVDQGFLNVGCTIEGYIDTSLFEKAWNKVVQRHEILRTTVHWKDLKQPVQIVHKEKSIMLRVEDWSNLDSDEKEKKWKEIKTSIRKSGAKLEEGALLSVIIVYHGQNITKLLWPSHHLLVDGWSSNNILKDVIEVYDVLLKKISPTFETLPSYKSYLNWLGKKDAQSGRKFWSQYFQDFEESHLFIPDNKNKNVAQIEVKKLFLSTEETLGLQKLAKESKVALNAVVQGIWSLLLFRYFDTNDMVHGTTVSGRSSDFPNIHLLTGMYMNVQPVRNTIQDQEKPLTTWFKYIQERQQRALEYEYMPLNEVLSQTNSTTGSMIFDSLLVYENFPEVNTNVDTIKVSNFQSGLTSTYPMTIVVLPGEQMEFLLSFSTEHIDEKSRLWIYENLYILLKHISSGKVKSFADLIPLIEIFKGNSINAMRKTLSVSKDYFSPPRTDFERQLVEIWQILFGRQDIGINDNFFEIGGKSLMAVQMAQMIERKIPLKFQPTMLILNPTIASIAQKLSTGPTKTKNEWKFLVPFRTKGNKAPIFSFHAGEGHILFYKLLPLYINNDRPFYALQPKGINGDETMHENIEEMCTDYISEIEDIQNTGTYNFVFYCYSALAVEISDQLRKKGKKVNLIVVDSLIGPDARFDRQKLSERLDVYLKKMVTTPFSTIGNSIKSRFKRHLTSYYNTFAKDVISDNLIRIREQLDKNHKEYHWKKFNTNCTLVLTKSEHPKLRQKKIKAWNDWCDSEVKVILNSGNHFNQFEEPHVKTLGQYVEEAIVE
ncbi:condensation domain-containing protein [uncultured Kriegella sp.]|uniref:condensation domain-containing protein n=1 Tax=uncultured Kriegella sp. TaxID=1798910 RepID=UPI0030DC8F3F|tara:strand:+ start:119306 stop:121708 length:2403 start_codon:yes stop_codon:yes gene_type:complete